MNFTLSFNYNNYSLCFKFALNEYLKEKLAFIIHRKIFRYGFRAPKEYCVYLAYINSTISFHIKLNFWKGFNKITLNAQSVYLM